MQQTEADVDKSNDDCSEVDINESSAANRETMFNSTATDMQSPR